MKRPLPPSNRSYWLPGDYQDMAEKPNNAVVRPSYHMEYIKKYGNIYPKEQNHEDIRREE